MSGSGITALARPEILALKAYESASLVSSDSSAAARTTWMPMSPPLEKEG